MNDTPIKPAIGIDLGTTFSVIAHVNDVGRPETIPNAEGDLLTPSVILFDEDEVIVGREAAKAKATELEKIADCPKRQIGNQVYDKVFGDRRYPPEALQGWILNKLKRDAARVAGDFDEAVITVPAYFDEVRRKSTQDSGFIGGLKVLEITLRTPCALAAIKAISKAVPDAHVGAGTVCNSDDFSAAIDAGARFIVSPGQSDSLFDKSITSKTPLLPGAVTATEVMRAAEAGFKVLKFFPASTSGGAAAIKAFSGPFASVSFVPTGGIGPKNLLEYLELPNVQAAGGSWMLPKSKVQAGDWQAVTQLCREASELSNMKELTQ